VLPVYQLLWLVHMCQVGVIALLFRYRNIVISKIMIQSLQRSGG